MVKIGIVGGTGYTGVELLRLLAQHPQAKVVLITSRSDAGTRVEEMYPNLRGHYPDLLFSEPNVERMGQCDVVFFATPHGVAHSMAQALLDAGTRVIDLSADFRLRDADEWAEWYGQPHGAPELLSEAIYGLPELVDHQRIQNARLIAVPGCYPTSVQLGLAPLLEAGWIHKDGIIADCKSGVSGAGRTAKLGSLLCESSESMKAYSVGCHRHHPEITQGLSDVAGQAVGLTFVPHLTPMIRGIHSTLYVRLTADNLKRNDVEIQQLYAARYDKMPCVDLMPWGACPETRSVRGSNLCRIALHRPQNTDLLVVLSVIDNLVKGASGQAIQNMNLMFGFDESLGLVAPGLMP